MMHKSTILLAGFLALFMPIRSVAQHVAAQIGLIGLFDREQRVIRPSLEATFAKHFSGVLFFEQGIFQRATSITQTVNSSGAVASSDEAETYRMTGWAIGPELRYYPFKRRYRAPAGLFFGGFYRYSKFNESYTGDDAQKSTVFNRVPVSFTTSGTTSHFGGALGYKLNLGVFALEAVFRLGSGGCRFETPSYREKMDLMDPPDENSPYLNFEITAGFIFPKIKQANIYSNNAPSAVTGDPSPGNAARIIIYRVKRFGGGGIDYNLKIGDSVITRITNGAYHEYLCAPGPVKFHARTLAQYHLSFDAEKGHTYYLECGVKFGLILADPYLELVSPEKGIKRSDKARKKIKK